MPGECQGPLLGSVLEANAVACRTTCDNTRQCDWFTFHPSDGLCVLYDRCPTIDIVSCPSCVTGTLAYLVTRQVDYYLLVFVEIKST